jgi:FkbM family methyltransferase
MRSNPRLLMSKFAWRLRTIRSQSKGSLVRKVLGKVECCFELDEHGPIWHMCYGAYDLELVDLMKRAIRSGDTIIDVGANVGYITAVAAALAGPSGSVHAFEPEPRCYDKLTDLVRRNPAYQIHINAVGLGDMRGTAKLDISDYNIGWNTMVPGFMNDPARVMDVESITFDEYANINKIRNVTFIKIDTEGYEYHILRGMRQFLSEQRPLIMCEIAPKAFPGLAITALDFQALIDSFNYRVVDIANRRAVIQICALRETTDVLLVPNA